MASVFTEADFTEEAKPRFTEADFQEEAKPRFTEADFSENIQPDLSAIKPSPYQQSVPGRFGESLKPESGMEPGTELTESTYGELVRNPLGTISSVAGLPFKALGAVGADILNRGRMEGGGTPEVLAPRFGETPEERKERLSFGGSKPIIPVRGTALSPEGNDLERLISQWSTPEAMSMLPAGVSRAAGALMLAQMIPSLPGQIKEIASGEGTETEKRDRVNNLVAMGVLMLARHAKPDFTVPKEPPPWPTGADLPMPRGSPAWRRPAFQLPDVEPKFEETKPVEPEAPIERVGLEGNIPVQKLQSAFQKFVSMQEMTPEEEALVNRAAREQPELYNRLEELYPVEVPGVEPIPEGKVTTLGPSKQQLARREEVFRKLAQAISERESGKAPEKEPWQMTKAEYSKARDDARSKIVELKDAIDAETEQGNDTSALSTQIEDLKEKYFRQKAEGNDAQHFREVLGAIAEGKITSHPDYPSLSPKPPEAPPVVTQAPPPVVEARPPEPAISEAATVGKGKEGVAPTTMGVPPRVLPGYGINSKDVARQYGMPDDFYGTADEQGQVSSKYRTKEYDDAVEAERRVQKLQGINATTIRRQARQRTEKAFEDLVEKARISAGARTGKPEPGQELAPSVQGLKPKRQTEAGQPPPPTPAEAQPSTPPPPIYKSIEGAKVGEPPPVPLAPEGVPSPAAQVNFRNASVRLTKAGLNYIIGEPRDSAMFKSMSKKKLKVVQDYWTAADELEASKHRTPTTPPPAAAKVQTEVAKVEPELTEAEKVQKYAREMVVSAPNYINRSIESGATPKEAALQWAREIGQGLMDTPDDVYRKERGGLYTSSYVKGVFGTKAGVAINAKEYLKAIDDARTDAIRRFKKPTLETTPPPAAAKVQTEVAKVEPKFNLTFKQFLQAPREGELLDTLRSLPKREKTAEELSAIEATDKAYAALDKANLTWMIDHPEQGRNLSKAKQKVWDNYNKAWQERQRVEKAHAEEAQKFLYDELVKAGRIQEPTPAPPAATGEGMPLKQSIGGAVPAEFEGNESFVSNMFAAIDRDRIAMGKAPMGETRSRTWDEDNQRALSQMNRDPKWIPDLLDRMEKSPRPLLSWENAGVVWQRAAWKAEYNNALQRIARAFDDNREADLTAAKTDAAVFEDKLERLDRIVGRNGTGSEAGRSLQAQKMGAGDDFTLVEMTLQKRAAVGGRRLTPEETAKIQKEVERLNQLNAALKKSLADADAARLKAETERAMAELRASKVPTFDQRILAAAESIVVKMERAAEPAAARLRERLMRMSAGVDPTIIYDAAVVGSARIARLGLDLAKFTDSMVKDFSEKIRPLIPEIWAKANEMIDAVKAPEPIKRAIRKTDLASVKVDVANAIAEKLAKKEMSKVRYELSKLAKAFWKEGIRDREEMVDALFETVGDKTGLTRRQVAEAFAGYGDFKQLSKDKMSLDLRGMKGELQQIAKLEAMQRGEPPLKSGLERRTPTDVERQLIKQVNDAKNKFQVPISDPNTQLKSALDTLKTTLTNRIKDYEERLAKKDYAERPRREVQLDTEATRLKAQAEFIKKKWRQELLADRMKNRTPWEKVMDWGTKYRRFTALSSPVVIPKLIGAAGWRGVATLLEDVSGRAVSMIPGISEISRRAPLEGAGGQLRATMRGFGAAFTKGLEDAARVGKTGSSDLDILYGKAHESYTGESEMASALLAFPGRMHGVIKAPVKRAAFEKASQRLGEFYAAQGLDVTSEPVKLKIAMEAYKAGNRAIFLQDNRLASMFTAALQAAERKGETGHPTLSGKLAATALRMMFPVTRVPVNIAAETFQYTAGVPVGLTRAANAVRKGFDTLTPDQADLIMRELKKGSIGLAALYLGYMGYREIGGVHEQGKKRKPGDVKPAAVRMFGVDIPENLLHHPVMNTIQLGATVHRTAEEKLRKGDADAQGFPAGVIAASWGLADEVPFIQGPHRLFSGFANPYTREQTLGMEVGSIVIPQAVAWTAQVLDQRRESPPSNLYQRITGPPARLKPRNIGESLEMRIPGLRQNVPVAPTGNRGASGAIPSFVPTVQQR